jgi:hypothetical protein
LEDGERLMLDSIAILLVVLTVDLSIAVLWLLGKPKTENKTYLNTRTTPSVSVEEQDRST